ncbi:MAG: VWA domain-containing protein [Ectothiorhodospiraceae bacterium]|nr:VWA domain-containing protein [Ectothiorhodospiraceae bacterium]MCH8505707.1 VWA domain-containing protein [Ectothiorhodospiraceae bacterium]
MPKTLSLFLAYLLALTAFPANVSGSEQQAGVDVRILMDVSASMLRTDPSNLRQPAQRLLAELLPAEARAGIWNFGDGSDVVIPVSAVNASWRTRARNSAAHIHSMDQWTDIREALETVSADWHGPAADPQRHIVLFTDGEVDVADDPRRNAEERRRILEETLPALKSLGVVIHTIGLSDEIDHALLKALADSTGGGYLVTEEPEELQRLFLHMFDRVADRETVPLDDNRFTLDDSISEATILAFRGDDTRVRLHPPGGEPFDARRPPRGVTWRQESLYELITIDSPQPGQWRLEAEFDPDNRVMIVTDLRLHMQTLPSQVLVGERVELEAWLTTGDDRLTSEDFLRVLDVAGTAIRNGGEAGSTSLSRSQSEFRATLPGMESAGTWTVRLTADGGSFQRQRQQTLTVIDSPLIATLDALPGETEAQRRLTLTTPLEQEAAEQLRISAELTMADGRTQRLDLPSGTGRWHVDLDFLDPAEDYRLALRAEGALPGGRAFDVSAGEFSLPAYRDGVNASAQDNASSPGPNLLVVSVFLVLFNLVLIAIVAIGYLLMIGRKSSSPGFDDQSATGSTTQAENSP